MSLLCEGTARFAMVGVMQTSTMCGLQSYTETARFIDLRYVKTQEYVTMLKATEGKAC